MKLPFSERESVEHASLFISESSLVKSGTRGAGCENFDNSASARCAEELVINNEDNRSSAKSGFNERIKKRCEGLWGVEGVKGGGNMSLNSRGIASFNSRVEL